MTGKQRIDTERLDAIEHNKATVYELDGEWAVWFGDDPRRPGVAKSLRAAIDAALDAQETVPSALTPPTRVTER